MKKFYIVTGTAGGVTVLTYSAVGNAMDCAQNLAKKNPGHTFTVSTTMCDFITEETCKRTHE